MKNDRGYEFGGTHFNHIHHDGVLINEKDENLGLHLYFDADEAIAFATKLLRESRRALRHNGSITIWCHSKAEGNVQDWLDINSHWDVEPTGPFFKLGENVRVTIMGDKVGTIARVPKRRSTGVFYGGEYAYDVSFPDHNQQRLCESHLAPVVAAAKAGQ